MKFEIYCDESMTDLFTSKKNQNEYLMIGSLWIHAEQRLKIKTQIKQSPLWDKEECIQELKNGR